MAYMIIEDGQPMDGEIYHNREAVMRASQYAGVGAQIVRFAVPGRSRVNEGIILNITEDVVRDAYANGFYDDPENDRHRLPGEFIDFPLSRSEAAEARAEQRFEEARDHHAMGWL